MAMLENRTTPSGELDSGYAWWRLVLTLVLGTVACVGNWSVVVLLPTLEIEFGTVRRYPIPARCLVLPSAALSWVAWPTASA